MSNQYTKNKMEMKNDIAKDEKDWEDSGVKTGNSDKEATGALSEAQKAAAKVPKDL